METLKVNRWGIIQFIYICLFSTLFYLFSINAIGILKILEFKFDLIVFCRVVFFLLPFYIVYVWIVRNRITGFDFGMQFTPFLLWFILMSIFGGKSATNFYIVEFPIVVFISGFYMVKYIFLNRITEKNDILNWSILVLQYLLVISMYTVL